MFYKAGYILILIATAMLLPLLPACTQKTAGKTQQVRRSGNLQEPKTPKANRAESTTKSDALLNSVWIVREFVYDSKLRSQERMHDENPALSLIDQAFTKQISAFWSLKNLKPENLSKLEDPAIGGDLKAFARTIMSLLKNEFLSIGNNPRFEEFVTKSSAYIEGHFASLVIPNATSRVRDYLTRLTRQIELLASFQKSLAGPPNTNQEELCRFHAELRQSITTTEQFWNKHFLIGSVRTWARVRPLSVTSFDEVLNELHEPGPFDPGTSSLDECVDPAILGRPQSDILYLNTHDRESLARLISIHLKRMKRNEAILRNDLNWATEASNTN